MTQPDLLESPIKQLGMGTWIRDIPILLAALVTGYTTNLLIYQVTWDTASTSAKVQWTPGVYLNSVVVNHHILTCLLDTCAALLGTLIFFGFAGRKLTHNGGRATVLVFVGMATAELVSFALKL